MNELVVDYGPSKGQKVLPCLVGGYAALYGLYNCITLALQNMFSVNFYFALALVILGAILLLSATLWVSKPIFKMDSNSLSVRMSKNQMYTVDWIEVKEVSMGISYLKFSETDGKDYTVDIGGLRYTDLKQVKSQIVELCESKNISYRND